MFTSFGKFSRYTPQYDPEDYAGSTPIFLQNEAGQDFYELRATLYEANGPVFVRSDYDAFFTVTNGVVSVVSKDPTRIFPQDQHFWGYQGPDAFTIAAEMLFDGETLSPAPPPPYVPIEIGRADLLARLTEAEFEALDISIEGGETRKVYKTFEATLVYVEGSAMWELLVKHLNEIVSEARLAELLARPGQGAAMAGNGGEVVPA